MKPRELREIEELLKEAEQSVLAGAVGDWAAYQRFLGIIAAYKKTMEILTAPQEDSDE